MTNFLLGGIISFVSMSLYFLGSFVSFTFADRGQPLNNILMKVTPQTLTNLGELPAYIPVKQYNKNFTDTGKHVDLIRLLKNSKQSVVMVLWAPSCPKCKTQLAALAKISKKYKNIKFVSVVATVGSTLDEARKYWQKNVGGDHNMILVEDQMSNQINGKQSMIKTIFTMTNQPAIPTTIFVNKNMEVLSAVIGAIKWDLHASRIMNCKFEK